MALVSLADYAPTGAAGPGSGGPRLRPLRSFATAGSGRAAPPRQPVQPPVPVDPSAVWRNVARVGGIGSMATGGLARLLPKDSGARPALNTAGGIASILAGLGQVGSSLTDERLAPAQRALGAAGGALGATTGAFRLPAVSGALPGISSALATPISNLVPSLQGTGVGNIPIANVIGAAINVAQTALSDLPDEQKALYAGADVVGAAFAPTTFGLSALAAQQFKQDVATLLSKGYTTGEKLGKIALSGLVPGIGGTIVDAIGLFKPKIPHGVRESMDLANIAPAVRHIAADVQNASTPDELYDAVLRHQSGYVGGSNPYKMAVNVRAPLSAFDPGDVVTPAGFDAQSDPYLFPFGAPNARYPVLRREAALRLLAEDPGRLFGGTTASVQAGLTPAKLAGFNSGLGDVIQTQKSVIDQFGPLYQQVRARETDPSFPVNIIDLARAYRPGLDPDALTAAAQASAHARRDAWRRDNPPPDPDPYSSGGGLAAF